MVSFVTLFIGLVLGFQTIEVAVDPAVARVELRLDEHSIGVLDGPDWTLRHDFGSALLPRQLEAIALDKDGRRLASVRQWLNLPRSQAEVSLVLEGGRPGAPERARLAWESVVGAEPRSVTAALDGRPLATPDKHLIPLPPLDPENLHYLRVELEFSDVVSTVVERVFGGTYTDEIAAELTALPIELAPGTSPPSVEAMQGWLTRDGLPLEIAAIERGGAEIIVVRDEGATEAFNGIQRGLADTMRGMLGPRGLNESTRMVRDAMPLPAGQRLRFLAPFAAEQKGTNLDYALFPSSPDFSSRDAGIFWLLSHARPQRPFKTSQRLADAVAVAGLSAAGSSRRRAVVLVIGRDAQDASQLPAAEARRYLEALRVPFRVWSLESKRSRAGAAWEPAMDISTAGRLDSAVQELLSTLDRQVIVWVRGSHLPSQVAVASGAPLEEAR